MYCLARGAAAAAETPNKWTSARDPLARYYSCFIGVLAFKVRRKWSVFVFIAGENEKMHHDNCSTAPLLIDTRWVPYKQHCYREYGWPSKEPFFIDFGVCYILREMFWPLKEPFVPGP